MSYTKKTKLPTSACNWTWSPSKSGDGYGNPVDVIREKLGIKGTKMPRDMHGTYRIDGWDIVVTRGARAGSRKSSKHRIFVRHNGRLIPAGRVRQALCATDRHEARQRARRARGAKGRFKSRWDGRRRRR